MPITPLHAGVLAPINHFAPGKVSNVSFILVNVWIDLPAILYVLTGTGEISHGFDHTFFATFLYATFLGMLGFRSRKWVAGAALGAISHTLLDSLVHPELQPFAPFLEGNPLYLNAMEPLSGLLALLLIWLIVQIVSGSLAIVRGVRAGSAAPTDGPSA